MKVMFVAALALAAIPAVAQAGPREDVLVGTARCGGISDDRAWLDCYYGAAQPMRARLGLTPAPAAQTALVPGMMGGNTPVPVAPTYGETAPPAQRQQSGGGLMGALFGGKVLVSRIPLAAYSFDNKGIVTVTLANGQIWEQLHDDDRLANWNKPAGRYTATVKEGSLGSSNLMVSDDNHVYKVRRIR